MKNKRILSVFFIILLVLLSSNISFADTGVVNTAAVRIREKPSKDSKILTRAYEDDEVEILEEDGDWYKVTANGKTGYASKSLIKLKNTTNNKNTENNKKKDTETSKVEEPVKNNEATDSKTTIKEDAVARVMPNFGSNELMLLTKGTEIEVIREFNNWSEIFVSGKKCWILKNKIDSGEVETESKPSTPEPVEEPKKEEENVIKENNTVKTENTIIENTNKVVDNNTVDNNTSTDTRNTKGIIIVETANVREKADKSSKIIDRLDENDEVTIVSEEGDWYKITSSKVESGYVSKKLVKIPKVSSRGTAENREEVEKKTAVEEIVQTSKGLDVVNFAKQYLDYKYVLGGKTPETGFDCSGFTRYVFNNFGYSLGTVAADQNSLGTEIERTSLQQGDLILFYNEGKTKIGHTGIYIGNDEFIHAANPDRGVVIDNLVTNSYYSTRFVTARRIVE